MAALFYLALNHAHTVWLYSDLGFFRWPAMSAGFSCLMALVSLVLVDLEIKDS